jgi:hypothetical protein
VIAHISSRLACNKYENREKNRGDCNYRFQNLAEAVAKGNEFFSASPMK